MAVPDHSQNYVVYIYICKIYAYTESFLFCRCPTTAPRFSVILMAKTAKRRRATELDMAGGCSWYGRGGYRSYVCQGQNFTGVDYMEMMVDCMEMI